MIWLRQNVSEKKIKIVTPRSKLFCSRDSATFQPKKAPSANKKDQTKIASSVAGTRLGNAGRETPPSKHDIGTGCRIIAHKNHTKRREMTLMAGCI